jgi:KDO2-lipid IV(A) lauroyltransferase
VTRFLLKALSAFFCRIPRSSAMKLGGMLGRVFGLANVRRNAVCAVNMDIVLEKKRSPEAKKRLIRRMYVHMGKHFAEFLRLPRYFRESLPHWVHVEGREHWTTILEEKRGAIIILSHLGCWEMLSPVFAKLGVSRGAVVVKPVRNRAMNAFVRETRGLGTIRFIEKKHSARRLLAMLKENVPVGFILDQNMNLDHGVFVPFGKKKACTLSAPAMLALRYRLPVFGAFLVRTEDDGYRLILTPEIRWETSGNFKQDILTATRTFSEMIREKILEYPEQWIWMHKRFRDRPRGEDPVYPPRR